GPRPEGEKSGPIQIWGGTQNFGVGFHIIDDQSKPVGWFIRTNKAVALSSGMVLPGPADVALYAPGVSVVRFPEGSFALVTFVDPGEELAKHGTSLKDWPGVAWVDAHREFSDSPVALAKMMVEGARWYRVRYADRSEAGAQGLARVDPDGRLYWFAVARLPLMVMGPQKTGRYDEASRFQFERLTAPPTEPTLVYPLR
ncbi:MAG: hypothetical protein KC620_19310, partial [Myxococcales bacterium]|nr:hypothetical protein [Myxococcales bacterium]